MMGGGVNTGEMFEKLESMRAVVTEVNTQFKNPVSLHCQSWTASVSLTVLSFANRNSPLSFPSPFPSSCRSTRLSD